MDEHICGKFKIIDGGYEYLGICEKGGYSTANHFEVFALSKGNHFDKSLQNSGLFWGRY